MRLTIPTNWDVGLLEELAKMPEVVDLYGKKAHDIVGGGRPHFFMKDVSDEQVAEYVNKVHSHHWTFSYLLNAPCMNNMEFDAEYHQKILDLLQWISDIGVDSVTLTIPYLVQLVKEQFPKLKVRVSVIAHVNSVNRAKLFEAMGVDEITVDTMLNRDFLTLEKNARQLNVTSFPLSRTGASINVPSGTTTIIPSGTPRRPIRNLTADTSIFVSRIVISSSSQIPPSSSSAASYAPRTCPITRPLALTISSSAGGSIQPLG